MADQAAPAPAPPPTLGTPIPSKTDSNQQQTPPPQPHQTLSSKTSSSSLDSPSPSPSSSPRSASATATAGSTSSQGQGTTAVAYPQALPLRSLPPPSPSRRLSAFAPSSPLSTTSSAITRGRQSSTSSNVSSTGTPPTSIGGDDSAGEEATPTPKPPAPFPIGDNNVNSLPSSPLAAMSSSSLTSSTPPPKSPSSVASISPPAPPPTMSGNPPSVSKRLSFQSHTNTSPSTSSSLSTQDLLPPPSSPSTSYSSSPYSPGSAGSVGGGSSVPISISTALPPASVRLSTTPHFPSPLAQASGPDEDGDLARGEGGDTDTEEDEDDGGEADTGDYLWSGGASGTKGKARDESPLTRESTGVFGDMELSPSLGTVGLPDINSLGLESQRTPRPLPRPSNHQRSMSGRDSSPEVDASRTARANRVRSLGRTASNLGSGSSTSSGKSPDESFGSPTSPRRRSRTTDIALTGSSSSFIYPRDPTAMSTPSSPTLSASPSSISRRTSINLVSPPRPFAPSSPTLARSSRSSLSAALQSSMPMPYPAPPVPSESIKLQKVPEAVRSAIDFRPASLSAANTSYLEEVMGPAVSSASPFLVGSTEIKVPKTPSATRAPSPVSGSGSGSVASDTVRSPLGSQSSSRVPSRAPSRRGSKDQLVVPSSSSSSAISPPPPTLPASLPVPPLASRHGASSSLGSQSAFAPLFPFPSAPPPVASSSSTRRDRSKSVFAPSSSFLTNESPTSAAVADELGISAQSQGASPFGSGLPGLQPTSSLPNAAAQQLPLPQGRDRLAGRRTSVMPIGLDASGGTIDENNTDEYAQIILASRHAKMRKWKTSTSSSSSFSTAAAGFDAALGGLTGESFTRRPISSFTAEGEGGPGSPPPPHESDITEEGGLDGFGASALASHNKEIEWVDWLDEYRKMKEAKLKAEEREKAEAEAKAKREEEERNTAKASETVNTEYNPFEATTADINYRRTTGFLTPDDQPQQNQTEIRPVHSSLNFSPKTTAVEQQPQTQPQQSHSGGAALNRTTSSVSTGNSPGTKRRKNFKLGSKIDAWWSAVRTSFSVGSPDESDRGRRTSDTPPTSAREPPAASRTSSQFARPVTPQVTTPTLRNAASAQDLMDRSRNQAPGAPPQFVPAGALAPGVRGSATLQLPKTSVNVSSGSESDGNTTKPDTRRRNPHLSLNLGPSFNAMLSPKATQAKTSDSSSSASGANDSANKYFAPRAGSATYAGVPSGMVGATPGLTPGRPPMWDKTPGLVPRSTTAATAGRTSSVAVRPDALQDATASANVNFSMHTIRQQIRLRLSTAKENCDKELRKIIVGITAHVEHELHKDHKEIVARNMAGHEQFGELVGEDAFPSVEFDSESEALADVDAEYDTPDSDGGTSRPSSRAQSVPSPPSLRPGAGVALVRRQSKARNDSPRRQSLAASRTRHLSSRLPELASYSMGGEKPRSGSAGSATSSRSNSRSRSPLPPGLRNVSTGSRSPAHSSNSHLPYGDGADLAQSAFIVLLQEIITVATEILDTPILTLTARPGSCAEYIQRVQQIGKAWDDNPELPCRGFYVQLLLAVAGLSRVAEWWELERGFWTFDDGDEEDAEPILFVAKPEGDTESLDYRTPGQSYPPAGDDSTSGSPPLKGTSKYSPLGIDLGVRDDGAPIHTASPAPASPQDATKQDAEDLRQAVDQVRSQTLLMELSLDGQLFQYLSSAWEELVGLPAEECLDASIAEFLYPDDAAVFAEATRQLEADDSHTVEVSFRLRVAISSVSSQDEDPEDLYEVMEGKGMLMLDGLSGGPSHTMWVVRPAPLALGSSSAATSPEEPLARFGFHRRVTSDPVASFHATNRLPTEPVLCRICERATPAWFFEKHNETCNETHRLEHDISECNDRLRDLVRSVDDIMGALEHVDEENPAEYRGIALLVPPPVPTPPSYLEGLRPPLSTRPQALQIRKTQHRVLDQITDILQTALSISTPSVVDETGDIPIQDQRLLSPNSENKLAVVMRWQRPAADEPALIRLIADTEEQTRFKLNSVNRLRNTILYAEKVRQEWEDKAAAALSSTADETPWANDQSLVSSPQLQPLPSSEHKNTPETLDLPHSASPAISTIRRKSSSLFGMMSPLLQPDDANRSFGSPGGLNLALSPRIPSGVPSSRTKASSIKDFDILKPISKGAFGSVYLAKKVTTGDYYAIKVLKKSDMIAKNQVTNVKAERMILMTQTESDFVVKLYYTFQSKDYLFLVMEYLNGGDCAALVKNMGELPEEWARKYIAEVVVGLEYLHASGIVHRDLKPDNLLIDPKGHLKLTDFGLSRIGLLGRQTRMPMGRDRRAFDSSIRSPSKEVQASNTSSPSSTPANALGASQVSYFGSLNVNDGFWLDTPQSESSGSGSVLQSGRTSRKATDSVGEKLSSSALPGAGGPDPQQKQFVGTPDYLAPESILGIGMDARVDWWALGVICYEFLYGIPPFHDETPEKVFENILSRRIEWHEDVIEVSPEAHDFMDRLLCSDANRRLGAGGAAEVKAHPFLAGIDWANLLSGEVDFIPKVNDPESTDYFDDRGAATQIFSDDDDGHAEHDNISITSSLPSTAPSAPSAVAPESTAASSPVRRAARERSETEPSPHDDFGTFNFRNLPVLKQANDDVIKQMRDQQLLPPLSIPSDASRPLSLAKPKSRPGSVDFRQAQVPSVPSTPSTSSSSSVPSLQSRPTAPSTAYTSHSRRPSEQHSAVDRLRPRPSITGIAASVNEHARRNSLPSRLRRASVSGSVPEYDRPPMPEAWSRRRTSAHTPPSSLLSSPADSNVPLPPLAIPESSPAPSSKTVTAPTPTMPFASTSAPTTASMVPPPAPAPLPARSNTIDCLIAGRNPISNHQLETMLTRLGCRCVVVPNGAEAILATNGVKFDIIWMDLQMPVVDGDKAARMIKSTKNPSSECPIIAVCSYGTGIDDELGTLFSGVLPKPILKANVLGCFRKLGFRERTKNDRRGSGDSTQPVVSDERRGSA